jgi:hypothetical protein
MDRGCDQPRNVSQQMILSVMGKIMGLSHCQVWADVTSASARRVCLIQRIFKSRTL